MVLDTKKPRGVRHQPFSVRTAKPWASYCTSSSSIESRHNLKYWTLGEYAGFGPGAHSDMGGVRFAYERNLDAYIAGDLHLSELEEIPPLDRDLEYIMLSLRTTRGIDSGYFGDPCRDLVLYVDLD